MNTAEEIFAAFEADENMAGYVDKVNVEEYGFSFVFDGYVDCAIVKEGDKWVDVQDCNLGDDFRFSPLNKEFIKPFTRFDSIEELVTEMMKWVDPQNATEVSK